MQIAIATQEIDYMSSCRRRKPSHRNGGRVLAAAALLCGVVGAQAVDLTIRPEQRATAQQVAQAGVPLSELAPDAPDSHTVQRGDTLWDISKLFLRSPWRWPELWGMNLEQIRNPHLIYPGQVLVLDKTGGRARLRLADTSGQQVPSNTVRLSPRVRGQALDNGAIAAIPMHLIGPFLNEAVVLGNDDLAAAPRVVATQEGRVMVSQGETAYVRGDLKGARDFRLFRETQPLTDPTSNELLGHEARFVGTAEFSRAGENRLSADGKSAVPVPDSILVTSVRQEVGVGDRLSPMPQRDFAAYVPHAPSTPVQGQIVSVYGEALLAGQNQIISINRGGRDGLERGHVLALWRDGADAVDRTGPERTAIKLPNERVGTLFVFRVFDRVSYALVLSATDPVRRGDRFTQP
ncbi:LysM peptidoglycan-binding domain-containing protein [Ideonella sp. A 288]|uniref:LysM peptidoglycan-binding domain-containing protein n=1 Tax=Ideonella sp. A 288 TaxID=1962181 RepID=UPI001F1AECC5|nr:LysM domain-containing protein [Ideonella sp. A 288]